MNKIFNYLKKQAPTILTAVSICGVVGTAIASAQAATKAEKLIRKRTDQDEGVSPALTTKEKVQVTWPAYISPAIIGLSTIGCIVSANILNRHQQAAIAGAYIFLDQTYRKYREKIIELYGTDSDKKARNEVVKDAYEPVTPSADTGTLIFYEEHYGQFFERKMAEVIDAQYQLNRKYATEGEASVNDFLKFLGLDPVKGGDVIGWEIDDDFYNSPWIDFEHEIIMMDDGMECRSINFVKSPVSLLPF